MLKCPALQSLRDTFQHHFVGDPTMWQLMWQDDLVGVTYFVDACLEVLYAAGSSCGRAMHLISPEVAGKDVI